MGEGGSEVFVKSIYENSKRPTKFSEHPKRGRLAFLLGIQVGVVIGVIIAGMCP